MRTQSNGSASSQDMSKRVSATIGNLGWDQPKDVVTTRAKDALTAANIDQSKIKTLEAVYEKGSTCKLEFTSSDDILTARNKMREANFKVQGAEKPVWLDYTKTQKELAPRRQLRKAEDFIKHE
eukprot:3510940-Karenia_brevis.AAC.1